MSTNLDRAFPGIEFKLGDRVYNYKLDMLAIIRAEKALGGRSFFEIIQTYSITTVMTLIWAGICDQNKGISIEEVTKLVGWENFASIQEKVLQPAIEQITVASGLAKKNPENDAAEPVVTPTQASIG